MKKYIISILLYSLLSLDGHSCSIFYANDGKSILAGNSEDWDDVNTMIKLIPPTPGKYGFMVFGLKDWGIDFCSWGGVNDQGVFYDWADIGTRNEDFHAKGTIRYNGILADKMLAECATVDEAIALFKKYNCPGFGGAHILIGDRFGNSVVIEKTEKDSLLFIKNTGKYQIATNFLNSYLNDPEIYRWVQCPRYELIKFNLSSNDSISIPLFENILQHVGNHNRIFPSVYSNIYDFVSGKMYIYNYFNFEEVLVLDINEALKRGYQFYKLPELFSNLGTLFPTNNEIINSESVEFKWLGDADTYEIWISTDEQFTNPRIVSYYHPAIQTAGFKYIWLYLILAVSLGIFRKRKIIPIGILLFLVFTGCEDLFTDLPDTKSGITHVKTIDNLEAGKKYFWKVVAVNPDKYNTETSVESFTISNY